MAATQYIKGKAQETMLQSLQSKFEDLVFGDLTIVCGAKEWKVNKLVLSTQSTWFEKVCKSKFKEAQEATITLPNDDPEAVRAMISWCYKFDYDDSDSDGENLIISRELLNVRVFALAEKCFIKPLQILAVQKFATAVKDTWASPDFAFAVKEAYQKVHDPEKKLRSAITHTLVEHCRDIFQKENEYPEIHTVVMEVPEVAADMAKEVVSPNHTLLKSKLMYWCIRCEVEHGEFQNKMVDPWSFGRSCPRCDQILHLRLK